MRKISRVDFVSSEAEAGFVRSVMRSPDLGLSDLRFAIVTPPKQSAQPAKP
jgi:hypothetical protein